MIEHIKIKTALISVSDKSGLKELAEALAASGVELYSTGGTEKFLRDNGFAVKSISDLTHFPEMMDGRVKTLHPMVHGGLLFRRDVAEHTAQAKEHNIRPIDLLVVNLYPFEATVAKTGSTHEEIIENIDIGGPAMLRSAGKNYEAVALLTSPAQYPEFIQELKKNSGSVSHATRLALAGEAFEHVAVYDRAIADYFEGKKKITLRYGENPHQKASVSSAFLDSLYEQLWGKELSYNNYLDCSASLLVISEFLDSSKAVVGIIKHTNPCGMAEGKDVLDAFEKAFATDTESPFGGIIVMNRPCNEALAMRVNEFFSEVILAPSFDENALTLLKKKKDRRLLKFDPAMLRKRTQSGTDIRSIVGGILEQESDNQLFTNAEMKSVTKRPVSEEEREGLLFTWKICKHVKSNAIVYAQTENGFARTIGIGCGQTSRVASSRLAVTSAKRFGHSLSGSLVASDAFFPFADGLIEAADAGAIAVIEPGGSVRDEEVIKAAEERNISLVMTGMRHFKH
ncbi:MAG: bifunctional phosphoribosylaminoimidazolecarboxamide formyltransferase/IMP cyclohydrolase [Bacteroidota bacterium]|nr:bifunctional phosphoribosylaminoimidazolecarboxamide formyltransferase/IMP cyclohydrolase [Bacteroidota bacterium]MDP4230359.1 bifunctional phosphoribosylaminoimidazolecarboxamide formyltransferase/IMP cyclohydrolase [Bacteroidota bacterium]